MKIYKCKNCGNYPIVVRETLLFKENSSEKYRVVCWECKWDGNDDIKTGRCKIPDNAVKIWNKKFGDKNSVPQVIEMKNILIGKKE